MYTIEYFNDIFKDWLRFDGFVYKNKEQVEKIVKTNTSIKLRIIEYEKPRRVRTKNMGRKTSVRQERVN